MKIAINFPTYFRKNHSLLLLCFVWLIGLLSGIYFFYVCRPHLYLHLCNLAFQPVLIIGLIFVVFLPLVCTYVALLTNNFVFLLVICFLKALAFSFTYAWITISFNSASWLVRFFFMFSDHCSLLILFSFWIRYSDNLLFSNKFPFFLCTILCFLLVAADCFMISPVLKDIF